MIWELIDVQKSENYGFNVIINKGKDHSYISRTPTGKEKPKYRYVYKHPSRGIVQSEQLKEGAKFRHGAGSKAGHHEVKSKNKDGTWNIKHDVTKETHKVNFDQLKEMIHSGSHKLGEDPKKRGRRLFRDYSAALEHGSKKQQEARLSELQEHMEAYPQTAKTLERKIGAVKPKEDTQKVHGKKTKAKEEPELPKVPEVSETPKKAKEKKPISKDHGHLSDPETLDKVIDWASQVKTDVVGNMVYKMLVEMKEGRDKTSVIRIWNNRQDKTHTSPRIMDGETAHAKVMDTTKKWLDSKKKDTPPIASEKEVPKPAPSGRPMKEKSDIKAPEFTAFKDKHTTDDYPYGSSRTDAEWHVEKNKKGERIGMRTKNPKTGNWNKTKYTTYGHKAKIAIGDDDRVYYVNSSQYSKDGRHISVQNTRKTGQSMGAAFGGPGESSDDPRWAGLHEGLGYSQTKAPEKTAETKSPELAATRKEAKAAKEYEEHHDKQGGKSESKEAKKRASAKRQERKSKKIDTKLFHEDTGEIHTLPTGHKGLRSLVQHLTPEQTESVINKFNSALKDPFTSEELADAVPSRLRQLKGTGKADESLAKLSVVLDEFETSKMPTFSKFRPDVTKKDGEIEVGKAASSQVAGGGKATRSEVPSRSESGIKREAEEYMSLFNEATNTAKTPKAAAPKKAPPKSTSSWADEHVPKVVDAMVSGLSEMIGQVASKKNIAIISEQKAKTALQKVLPGLVQEHFSDPSQFSTHDSEISHNIIRPALKQVFKEFPTKFQGFGPRSIESEVKKKQDRLPWGEHLSNADEARDAAAPRRTRLKTEQQVRKELKGSGNVSGRKGDYTVMLTGNMPRILGKPQYHNVKFNDLSDGDLNRLHSLLVEGKSVREIEEPGASAPKPPKKEKPREKESQVPEEGIRAKGGDVFDPEKHSHYVAPGGGHYEFDNYENATVVLYFGRGDKPKWSQSLGHYNPGVETVADFVASARNMAEEEGKTGAIRQKKTKKSVSTEPNAIKKGQMGRPPSHKGFVIAIERTHGTL